MRSVKSGSSLLLSMILALPLAFAVPSPGAGPSPGAVPSPDAVPDAADAVPDAADAIPDAADAVPGPDAVPDAAGASSGMTESWMAAVGDAIAAGEYHLSVQENAHGLTAPNRAQGLRGRWQDGALVITPRVDASAWSFRYELASVGRGRSAIPAPAISWEDVDAGRIEWIRGLNLREWYINDCRGIEQGFVLERRPGGDAQSPLAIDGRIDGLLAYPTENGQSVLLRTPGGVDAIRISHLVVTDASGVRLAACLDVGPGILSILVDDADATYPIVIDPLMTAAAWTAEGDQIDARFASTVATAGDVNGDGFSDVIVGSAGYDSGESNEGRAFVYHGSAAGLATTAAWTAESNQADAAFGGSVSTAGDVNGDGFSDVIVGAVGFDNGQTNEGRVFVFHGSASGLELAASWTAEINQADAAFGVSVSTAGDIQGDGYDDVIVGARLYDNGEIDEGAVFAYRGTRTGLAATAMWTVDSNQAAANFGICVAMAGDVNGDGFGDVIVGANLFDGGQIDEGAAFAYYGAFAGLPLAASWTVEGNQAGASFGSSVATAGDVNGDGHADVIVGAPRFDAGQADEGRAFVFAGSPAGLEAGPAWTAESDQDAAQFGSSVATAGDVNGDGYADVIIGAMMFDNAETDEGRAFVFHGSAAGLEAAARWTAESDFTRANFGISVAPAGDVNADGYSDVIVGAPVFANGQRDEGRAYSYHGSPAGLQAAAAWAAESDQGNSIFGISVSSAGDVNGDGYSDVIVGAWQFDDGENDEGAAFVYHGSAGGLSTVADWFAASDQISAYFGGSVATAGDVNGDGFADVIVGAYRYDNGQADEGRAFVYHGSAAGLSPVADWTAEIDNAGALFGTSVATAGDVNGDGYSDVIVGAPFAENGQTDEGRVFVYHGSRSGLPAGAAWIAEPNLLDAQFGTAVATAGDVNADGYSDVIIGAPWYSSPQSREGRAFVYHGGASGLDSVAAWMVESDQGFANLGSAVATAGDVNGDGYSDVIVGTPRFDAGQTDEGFAAVYHGSATGVSTAAAWTMEGNQTSAFYGACVATAGDVNGDGYSDVLVGAYSQDRGQSDEGLVFVYHGAASGLATTPSWTGEGDQALAHFGFSAATAGDVNGDGYSDIVVGAYWFDNGDTDEGGAFAYYGNDGPGLDRLPRQRRYDGGAPIQVLGIGDTTSGFRVHLRGRSPFGRARVRAEVEIKPFGTPFDGSGTLLTPFTDTGAPGPDGSHVELDVLQPTVSLTAHHWRARLLGAFPFKWQSHWMTLADNAMTETDLRGGIAPLSCIAGPDQVLECRLGSVMLDGSASSGPADRTYLWTPPGPEVTIASPTLPTTSAFIRSSGVHVIRLTVTSAFETLNCFVTLTAGDRFPPDLVCPATVSVIPTEPGAGFADVQATATDDCDTNVTIQNDRTTNGRDASDTYPCGVTLVTFRALDDVGHIVSCQTAVTVADSTPPLEISAPGIGAPLLVTKDAGGATLHVSFEDHAIVNEMTSLYAGTIPTTGFAAYDHVPVACKVAPAPVGPGVVELMAPWDAGTTRYYLVSASNCLAESPLGFASNGSGIPLRPTDCGPLP